MCSPVTTRCATTCREFRIKQWELLLCRLGDVSALARREIFSLPMLVGAPHWQIAQGKGSRASATMFWSWDQDGNIRA